LGSHWWRRRDAVLVSGVKLAKARSREAKEINSISS
jgi:hypothetical protein